MPHIAINGQTTFGKTFVAQELCADFRRRGIGTLVLDPRWHKWDCDWFTDDAEAFLRKAQNSRRCALFAEEWGEHARRLPHFEWIATQSRHWGHRAIISCQSPRQISTTVRENVEELYLFHLGDKGGALWSEQFGPETIGANALGKREFLHFRLGQPTTLRTLTV